MAASNSGGKEEAVIRRNPHPDFKAVEASRPPWDRSSAFHYTQTPDPSWAFGGGANEATEEDGEAAAASHVSIDPYAEGRPAGLNYKLLISAVVPRPIALVSTRSVDGQAENLAPFSYFQLVNHDPPLFVLGFASPLARAKDTLRNLAATGECVVNLV